MTVFRGLFPPLITPFNNKGDIDEKGLVNHVNFMIEGGADGLCAGSSTGEFTTFSLQEWEKVLSITKEAAKGRVPLLAGAADMSLRATIERCRFAEKLGYDGLLIISPWYQVHTQREIYRHFKAIRDNVTIPIMIYNNPPVTGIQLSIELLEQLTNDGIIQYLKDADSDPYKISRLKMRLGNKLQLFYGHDNNAIGAFAFGATGWVSGTSNFDPVRFSKLVHLCIDDNDYVSASRLWYELLPYIEIATVPYNNERPDWIAIIKRALEFRGRYVGTVRPPMLPVLGDVDRVLKKIVGAMTF